jgi:hypothetical protein
MKFLTFGSLGSKLFNFLLTNLTTYLIKMKVENSDTKMIA